MLTRLIYASRAEKDVSVNDICSILKSATRNNAEMGVTGILFFDRINFMQYLEGDRASVYHIYRKILADSRHYNITLLQYGAIERRMFGHWRMAYLSGQDDKIKNLIRNYSLDDQFMPHKLSERQALSLVGDFSQSIRTHIAA